MPQPQEVPEQERWKAKYYETLELLDRKEQEWHRVEHILRQCISRLSLAAEGIHRGLDRELDRLRSAIRSGAETTALEGLIDALSAHILRLDDERHRRMDPRDLLLSLLDKVSFPRGVGHKARALQKRLVSASEEDDLRRFATEFAGLVTEAIAGEQGECSGLLGRLFARGEEGSPDTKAAPAPSLAVARRILERLVSHLITGPGRGEYFERIRTAEVEAELLRVAEELGGAGGGEPLPSNGEVLLRLLERLDIPSELSDRVEAIKAELGAGPNPPRIDGALGAIADVVREVRSRIQDEKREIETFLKQLTQNLGELDRRVQENVARQRQSYEEGCHLGAAVQMQVQGIEESFQGAVELDTLKGAIQQRIATIRSHLDRFRESEGQRHVETEAQIQELTDRLQALEKESADLRERLRQERHLALIDPLTGIYNRLAFDERMGQEFARWRRYKSPLTLAVWDIDRFKSVNDTYGHQAGDRVLTVVAKLLRKQVRETDFIARFGGEEFIMLLPETAIEDAVGVAEKLRTSVAACEFHYGGRRVVVTASCGLAEFHEGDTPEQVFARADQALYAAKAGGRNQCREG